jgi:hypothetical protein
MTQATTVTLTVHDVERLIEIAERAGVRQGIDIVGPHDTVVLETVRRNLEKAKELS